MELKGDEVHVETDEARGASSNNIVRWVLLISLFAAIVLLSIIWITGAATQGDAEENVEVTARAEVAEGVIVREGAVLSMGVYLGASTKIVDRATGEVHRGVVPPYAVVVPGALPGKPLPDGSPGPSLYCAVIVKTVDAQTRSKTGINELLRD